MTPLPPYAYQGLTDMAQRDAFYNTKMPDLRKLSPKPSQDEPVSYEEFQRQMRFSIEAAKAEISQHVDNELERFRNAIKEKP